MVSSLEGGQDKADSKEIVSRRTERERDKEKFRKFTEFARRSDVEKF